VSYRLHLPAVLLTIAACSTAVPAAPAPQTAVAATTYHVSNSSGDDSHDGRAARWNGTHGPWRSLAKASTVKYQPGDALLLKCGDVWDETLTLSGDGTVDHPITVAAYGTGERPYIRRTLGKSQECIVLDKAVGYCIRDLELGFALSGIHVLAAPEAKPGSAFYRFENCFLHDIMDPGFPTSGGAWGWALQTDGGGAVCDVSIVHCIGLRTQGFYSNGARGKVVFDGNTVSHTSLNEVHQVGAAEFDITNCVFVYNYPWRFDKWGTTQVMAGDLPGSPDTRYDVIDNEFGWPGDYPGSPDGCGYDFETYTNGVTFQHNFVHNSYGEAVLFMGGFSQKDLLFDDNIFRDNVRFSPRWDCTIFLPLSLTGNGTISNNVLYLWPGKKGFSDQPTCFTYAGNDEHPTKPFVAMPLVTHIDCRPGARTYALASATPGATIRYTLDGSLPSPASPRYDRPIVIQRSGVLTAKAFLDGSYPSYVSSLAVQLREPEGGAPAAWWKLDEPSGTVVKDSAGTNDGSLAGATPTAGRIGRGLRFAGSGQAVNLEHDRLAAIADTFTVTFWARPTAPRPATPEAESGSGLAGAAWWKMDEGAGASLADSAGGSSSVISGCTWTDGKYGHALHFNGSSDSVGLNASSVAAVEGNFTLSFWADAEATRASTPEANEGISGISKQRYALAPNQYSAASGSAGVGVSLGTNGVSVFELADSYLPSPLVADRPMSGWNHVVVVYRDQQPSLFVNGELVRTGLKSTKTVHPAFSIGGTPYGWYQGKLEDVRVYPRALTADEVRQLATRGEAAEIPWTLGKASGTMALPYALAPISRGGGSDAGHAGMGVAVGTTGVSVCERSDAYLPSLLVDTRPLSGWNHIAVVYRDHQPTLYLNGVFEKAGCRSTKTVHPVLDLGGGTGLGWYAGKLDDVRVYSRALTDAEIQELAAAR